MRPNGHFRWWVCLALAATFFSGCSLFSSADPASSGKTAPPANAFDESKAIQEPRYTYHEFDMIFAFFKTDELGVYRDLLPPQFKMPADPLVMIFFADYYEMDRATQPYQEAAVFLLVDYESRPAWHCVTMPVTSNEARLGGIYYLGYPKIMGDISLQRDDGRFSGVLKLRQQPVASLELDTRNHRITAEERQLFQQLKGIRNLNIKNGRVFEPKFGTRSDQYTLLELSQMYPQKLEVKVGRPKLVIHPDAAADYSERLGAIFKLRPGKIVLAYYLKNKFITRFQN